MNNYLVCYDELYVNTNVRSFSPIFHMVITSDPLLN